jgi:Ca2+-binding EF-hand superfamily protein
VLEQQGETIGDVDKFFADLDRNEDGKIDMEEFSEHWKSIAMVNSDDIVASARCALAE